MPQKNLGPRRYVGVRVPEAVAEHIQMEMAARDCTMNDYVAAVLAADAGRPGLAVMPHRVQDVSDQLPLERGA